MSTLLTISQPPKIDFGGRNTHDFSPRISLAKSRISPKPKIDSPVSSLRASTQPDHKMTTPHRGLPLPSAMGLPDPSRPPPSFSQPLGSMPAPPTQWHGQEESMRHWLSARAEEDKRKQEEQRTRQEELRLEQRKVEQSMLRESLDRGVPPNMVPMMYAGIGGSSLTSTSLEMLHQYHSQLQASQQQIQQQPSPEMRREQRLLSQGPQQQYVTHQHQQPQIVPSQPAEQPPQPSHGPPLQTTFSAYQSGPPTRPPPTSAPRSATHTSLPRLTTNEMFVQPAGQQQGPGSAHPLQQTQTIQQQEQPASSPSIYFHHWHPPNESKSNQPQTPASKGEREPLSALPGSSHLSESDYKESPRKRKAQGPHQPAPAPSHTSPSFSTVSSGSGRKSGHNRTRSNTSTREPESRPDSRRDAESSKPSQLVSHQSSTDSTRLRESPARLGESRRASSSQQAHEYQSERPPSRQSR